MPETSARFHYTSHPPVVQRQAILEQSRELLIREGFANLSMRRIASRLGLSATALYRHFQGKDDLLLALIEQSVDRLMYELNVAASGTEDAADRLRAICERYVRFALDRPQEYEIMFLVRPEEMPRYPKEKFRRVREAYDLLAEAIRRGVRQGTLAEEEPDLAAYAIWAQMHGVVSVILTQRLDRRVPRERFVAHSLEHILSGYVQQAQPATP